MTDSEENPAIPAATVVLVRDGAQALEVLMLHRTSKVAFGGMWVFPGGRVDDEDRHPSDPSDEAAARRAAGRESIEECGLALEPHELVPFAHWVPPAITPRRYATWFFVARAADGEVVVDGGEMDDHAWLAPGEVLARRARGEIDLAPPTFVTLHDLAAHRDVEAALAEARRRDPVPRYATRFAVVEGGAVTMWAGDAGYAMSDPMLPGARHRLWMLDDGWHLDRSP